jgi:hypothetical protein
MCGEWLDIGSVLAEHIDHGTEVHTPAGGMADIPMG